MLFGVTSAWSGCNVGLFGPEAVLADETIIRLVPVYSVSDQQMHLLAPLSRAHTGREDLTLYMFRLSTAVNELSLSTNLVGGLSLLHDKIYTESQVESSG